MRVRLTIKWPYGDEWGWVIGNFKKMSANDNYKNAFVIRWDDGDESYWPKGPTSEYGPAKNWALIRLID